MFLKTAQVLTLALVAGGNAFKSYKAPHAYQGQPPRPRRRVSSVLMPRLFKGHRPALAGLGLALAAALAPAAPAPAQEAPRSLELRAPCYPRAFTERALSEGWQEAPAGLGVSLEGALVELWTSAAGETWTLVLTRPDGWSCTLSAGEFWQVLRDESGV